MTKFKCENCGGNLEMDSEHKMQFCQYCGTAIKLPETAFDREKFVMEHKEKVRQNIAKEELEKEKHDDKTFAVLFIVLIVVCAILMTLALILYYNKQG